MPIHVITVTLAAVLIAMGLLGYLGSGRASLTALIPSFFGAAFLICGLVAWKAAWRKHAMHAAALVALLGLGGSAPGLFKLPALFAGEAERPMAVTVQSLMAILLVVFLILCVKSFIDARRQRKAAAAAGDPPAAS